MERRDQERMLAGYAGLPSDAAAVTVTGGQPETAVEFLELGVESRRTATSMTARSLRCCARRSPTWLVSSKVCGTTSTASSCRI